MSRALTVGVGCRSGATSDEITALVRATLAECEGDATQIYTLDEKATQENLREAAVELALPLVGLSPATLQAESARLTQRSAAAEKRFGVPSVAEAAALAGAGPGAKLLALRKSAAAVCAVAA